ncbi:hypothetical protein PIB30_035508 [Stylosanthes scabra]|uniref:Uncharacterized protein n=1 Tax=Stylosanthes scabra TaxID=79078 RepID=A0ABU6YAD9_9FABA|nr:hypothetical protein [Stylosanthes scabra]
MGSGVIYYEYVKREKFEDYDMEADAELGTFKIRRYHFDNESFVHSLHSVRFNPNRLYVIMIEALMADKILSASKSEKSFAERQRSSRRPSPHYSPRTMPVAQRERSTSSVNGTCSFRHSTASSSVRKPRSWERIPPSEGWMCDADDEREIGRMEPSVEKGESSEEDPEMEEEDPEEAGNLEDRVPATPSLPMDIDAEEDFQRYIEELGRAPEPSPFRSSQASVPDGPVEAADRQSVSRDGSSYNLSEVQSTVSKIGVLHLSTEDDQPRDLAGGVRSGSGRKERKERKDCNKPRRPLLEPMRTHHIEPYVRIQAWTAHPIVDLGTYAYAYEASMRTHSSLPYVVHHSDNMFDPVTMGTL